MIFVYVFFGLVIGLFLFMIFLIPFWRVVLYPKIWRAQQKFEWFLKKTFKAGY